MSFAPLTPCARPLIPPHLPGWSSAFFRSTYYVHMASTCARDPLMLPKASVILPLGRQITFRFTCRELRALNIHHALHSGRGIHERVSKVSVQTSSGLFQFKWEEVPSLTSVQKSRWPRAHGCLRTRVPIVRDEAYFGPWFEFNIYHH